MNIRIFNRSKAARSVPAIFLFLFFLFCYRQVQAQVSNNVTITPQSTPGLTPCSGEGTFVVRVANLTAAPVSNLVFRDSMPPNINYIAGSVSGTGVTFGSTIINSNVVTFNIASIPASGFVDVTFKARTSCAVSTVAANIKNTYRVNWGTFFTNPYITATYPVLFPSLSVTVVNPVVTAFCHTPFVRQIQICNGGAGSVDSVTLTDVEGATVLSMGYSIGIVTGAGTSSSRTVLKASDFAAVGNGDGKLDQNECIMVYDTQKVVGATSPTNGTVAANWGCSGSSCPSPTTGNTANITTNINSTSLPPTLTRTLTTMGTDSAGNIYGRPITYREVVKNNSTVTAQNCYVWPSVLGLKYIVTDSIWASKNGAARYHPPYSVTANSSTTFRGAPHNSLNNVYAPATYTGQSKPNNAQISLGNLDPGDSVVITFEVRTAGPVTRVSDFTFNNCSTESFCSSCYRATDGPSISAAVDARMYWEGCPSGSYTQCAAGFPTFIYNGASPIAVGETYGTGTSPIYLSRFRTFSYIDSTALINPDQCNVIYEDLDTIKLNLRAGVMDLPFYTDKSKFAIKIYTGGVFNGMATLQRYMAG